ncbi:MAG: flagellar basal body rod protein FlgC [Pseudobutyrivibrio sp.]|nr:flagellar basal body rod protein FlgC [Pseudobutyrivibrio sp.]
MGLFQGFDIVASGLTAQRFRMDIIAENIANVNTTRTKEGKTYRRKIVTFEEKEIDKGMSFDNMIKSKTGQYTVEGNGVKVTKVSEDYETDYIMEYDPSHPDADENGYVSYPNVNTVTEMTNLIDASRSYEANATAFKALKEIASAGLAIGQS